ncbi:DUF2550 domain-containing protein [Antrihabitans spumae]|uniref:DUF2550 domain-containing protein n=1 Tax=Antrihabitans spumae TaxID=3373370 RepID=A0ABW7K940_9NOCA
MVLLIILVAMLAVLFAISFYRLMILRRGGTSAIIRTTPGVGSQGWRHGLIRYGEDSLVFYKLSSLRFGPDVRINRQDIAVENRRSPQDSEVDIMTDEIVVLSVREANRNLEVALDRGAMTAFLSWVESRPSGRSMRGRHG